GRQGLVPANSSALEAARALGVDLDTVCGGRGICGRCQVVPSFGEFSKHGIISEPSAITDVGPTEADYEGRRAIAEGRRLGCQVRLQGDVVLDVPPESQVHRQVVRKRLEVPDIDIDPVLRLYYLAVPEPQLDDPQGELARVREALQHDWNLGQTSCGVDAIIQLQAALGKSREVTIAVRDQREIVATWPGFVDEVFGVAIDVGSTTIAGHLLKLSSGEVRASSGLMNPQIRFGEDLMSRVSYVMMNPAGADDLTSSVRKSLDELVAELAEAAAIDLDKILEITLVGNPVMHHLVLGFDSVPLGGAPFALASDDAIEVPATRIGITAHPNTRVYVLPCIAGHVGADTSAAILSERSHEADGIQLLVDVGTNAEIVLGGSDRLLAASSPTGPAFEGAQISAGQRATAGAIERVRIDRDSLEPRFKVIGSDLWSDDPAFDEDTKNLTITGVCGSGIIEAVVEMHLAGIVTTDGVIDGSLAARSDRVSADDRTFSYLLFDGEPRLFVTQNDVRAIQLAKAALYAGVQLLLDHLEVDHVDSIRLAGAFGSHIDPVYAVALGLVPDCDLAQVTSAGNAAGTGAVIALLSNSARREIEAIVDRVEKIETATEPKFQDHFVDAMAIPHATAEYPHLSKQMTLPPRQIKPAVARSGRRRRRQKENT
ncbi:MAG: ASKHA domain-containing protein, partial [Acidimicrobiales bacterium]